MSTHLKSLILVSLLAWPLTAGAQDYTWHQLEIADPQMPASQAQLVRITTGDSLLVQTNLVAYLVSPERTLTALTCTGLDRYPNAPRQGPDFDTATNALTLLGNDELVVNGEVVLAAISLSGGTCTAFRVDGSVNSWYTAGSDDGTKCGSQQGSDTNLGLQRFSGFCQAPDNTVAALTGLCPSEGKTEWLQPVDRSTTGTLVVNALCGITLENTYMPAAGYYRQGAWHVLTAPNGQDLTLVSVNAAERALGWTQTQAYIIDLTTTPPTFTNMPTPPPSAEGYTLVQAIPRQLNDLNWIIVRTTELKPTSLCPPPNNPEATCFVGHQWIGMPMTPPDPSAPPTTPEEERKNWLQRLFKKTRQHLPSLHDMHERHADEQADAPQGWQPTLDADGTTVILTNRGRALGR